MNYKTIVSTSKGLYKDRGSKFIGFTFPIGSHEEIMEHLSEVRRTHHKARHFCHAYRLGWPEPEEKVNDDGEPSGSAGYPILNTLKSFEVTNILLVVVRYFGGKLLGVSGLRVAYRECARHTLENNKIEIREIQAYYEIVFPLSHMGPVMAALNHTEANLIEKQFEKQARWIISFPLQSYSQQLEQLIKELQHLPAVKIEYLDKSS